MTAVPPPSRPLHLAAAAALASTLTACAAPPSGPPPSASSDEWPAYAGSAGARFSPRDRITPANVSRLAVAWTYHTGELGQNARDGDKLTFEATPIHFDGRLYLSTAYGQVIALDPVTGAEQWRFDPGVDRGGRFSEVTSRGVSAWRDSRAAADAPCARRIFAATIDARLLALDAVTGRPCADFGAGGTVRLAEGLDVGQPARLSGDLATGSARRPGDHRIVDRRQLARRHRERGRARLRRAHRRGALELEPAGRPARPRPARPMPGRCSTSTPPATWSSCPPPAPAPTSSAGSGPAPTRMPTRSWPCAARPASSCGRSRPCTTTSGTTTSPRSRCWSTSRRDGRLVAAVVPAHQDRLALRARSRHRRAALHGGGTRRAAERHPRRAGVADAAGRGRAAAR